MAGRPEEQLAALQSQVTVLIEQIRTLSERTDTHGNALQGAGNISNINGAVLELQRSVQQLNAKDHTDQPSTKQQFLIHPKDVRVDDFYGDIEKFRDWLDDSVAYIAVIDPKLGKILTEIAEGPKEVDVDDLELTLGKEYFEDASVKVHGFLRMKFKKNAKIWLKTRKKNIGLETWRAMVDKYDPMSGASKLDLHKQIMVMRRVKNIRDAPGAIEDWEVRYNLYKQRTGK